MGRRLRQEAVTISSFWICHFSSMLVKAQIAEKGKKENGSLINYG
jgi:hypothetical protein